MESIKTMWARPWCRYLVVVIGIFGLLPLLFSLIGIPVVQRVLWLFMILNGLGSFLGGIWLRRSRTSGWWLLLPAAIFALLVLWRYADYNYWFCALYLCLGYIGFGWGSTIKKF
ncbi:hypothetical protein LH991_14270 [Schleiferilactobacillus harbinensis]|uniref:Uncharacterized protein n=2 Tax=Schleiferilactobacillus harbinensis TaxID=304207 RepID=A0A5P8M5T1_9LACO|nr:hypothetical protein [Schleiferilactobacillus harbinensis]MCI1782220.1 hypothetical protein [Schleiferilactobacillus harbinensis]MCI1850087.1 hypothetical protein [Schleiferilactobacillus harbinensis]QEU46688.1 hypothetical protein FMM01_04940 [Schleiferilactobacillus harbinensis]QFR23595.1 hypothetical protein D1010_09340 [Schleiferilactobacillus harbinensis]QFR65026.1 hypothetical protein LH991_14270 [Schleiferilactobacillus harbinensis]